MSLLFAILFALCLSNCCASDYSRIDLLMENSFLERDLNNCLKEKEEIAVSFGLCEAAAATTTYLVTEKSCCSEMGLVQDALSDCVTKEKANSHVVSELQSQLDDAVYKAEILGPLCRNFSLVDNELEIIKSEKSLLLSENADLRKNFEDLRPIVSNYSILKRSCDLNDNYKAKFEMCSTDKAILDSEALVFMSIEAMLGAVQEEEVTNQNVIEVFSSFLDSVESLKMDGKSTASRLSNCNSVLSTAEEAAVTCSEKLLECNDLRKSEKAMVDGLNFTVMEIRSKLEEEVLEKKAYSSNLSICNGELAICTDSLLVKNEDYNNLEVIISKQKSRLDDLEGLKFQKVLFQFLE